MVNKTGIKNIYIENLSSYSYYVVDITINKKRFKKRFNYSYIGLGLALEFLESLGQTREMDDLDEPEGP